MLCDSTNRPDTAARLPEAPTLLSHDAHRHPPRTARLNVQERLSRWRPGQHALSCQGCTRGQGERHKDSVPAHYPLILHWVRCLPLAPILVARPDCIACFMFCVAASGISPVVLPCAMPAQLQFQIVNFFADTHVWESQTNREATGLGGEACCAAPWSTSWWALATSLRRQCSGSSVRTSGRSAGITHPVRVGALPDVRYLIATR